MRSASPRIMSPVSEYDVDDDDTTAYVAAGTLSTTLSLAQGAVERRGRKILVAPAISSAQRNASKRLRAPSAEQPEDDKSRYAKQKVEIWLIWPAKSMITTERISSFVKNNVVGRTEEEEAGIDEVDPSWVLSKATIEQGTSGA